MRKSFVYPLIACLFVSAQVTAFDGYEGVRSPEACLPQMTSRSIDTSIEHILGFDEVRKYLNAQELDGLSVCYEGLTLERNQYRYDKNLIVFQIYSAETNQAIKKLAILFQNSSIQAHHNVGSKPWLVLDYQKFENSIEKLAEKATQETFKPLLSSASDIDQIAPEEIGNVLEPSLLPIDAEQSLAIIGGIKKVTGSGSSLYSQAFSSRFVLAKKTGGSWEITRSLSAFDFAQELSKNLGETTIQSKNLNLDHKIQLIETLTGQ